MAERYLAAPEDTERLGEALAGWLVPPVHVALSGPLGAGKTALVRAVLRSLGHSGPVRSPTYTLIETYPLARLTVHHLDLYRLADPEELEFLGVRDLATADAVWMVEWPDRGGDRLPPVDVALHIDYADGGRRVTGVPEAIEPGRS